MAKWTALVAIVGCLIGAVAPAQTDPPRQGKLLDITFPIPVLKQEITPAKPSDGHVWVPGHWDRSPGEWRWVVGAWRVPPFDGAYWVGGHWIHEGTGWRWTRGYWAVGVAPHLTDAPLELPTAPIDTKPPQPRGKTDWIPGHWEWAGEWRWVLGHWTTRPHSDATWTEGRWDRFGDSKWRWIPSHWAVPD